MRREKEKTALLFDRYSNTYSDTVNQAIGFSRLDVDMFTEIKAGYILDEANLHFGTSRGLDVLDIGCGVGNIHKLLAGRFENLHGIDISAESIEKATSNNPDVKYMVYAGETLPFDDNVFDFAYTLCVLHHVAPDSWNRFAREMIRVLKPGGHAMVFEHNPYNILTRHVVNRCPLDDDAVLLRPAKTRSLFGHLDTTNNRIRYIMAIPSRSARLRKIDRLFSHLPLGAQYYFRTTKSTG